MLREYKVHRFFYFFYFFNTIWSTTGEQLGTAGGRMSGENRPIAGPGGKSRRGQADYRPWQPFPGERRGRGRSWRPVSGGGGGGPGGGRRGRSWRRSWPELHPCPAMAGVRTRPARCRISWAARRLSDSGARPVPRRRWGARRSWPSHPHAAARGCALPWTPQ
jgi:hypothetical protein